MNTATAHPHYEPDGTTYNLGNSFSLGSYYNIIKIHPDSTDEGWSEIQIATNWELISMQRLKDRLSKFSDYNLLSKRNSLLHPKCREKYMINVIISGHCHDSETASPLY